MKNNIAAIRAAKGMSQADLAEQLDMHWTNLSKIERDKSNPGMDRYQQIAQVLGVDLNELFGEEFEGTSDRGSDAEAAPFLPYAGIAQAGVFVDINLHSNHEPQAVAISPDPRYRRARQYVWQVLGDSMNKAGILDGMFAVGVDYLDFVEHYRPIATGDIVVVERMRFDGQERERTIKRYWEEPNGIALMPESTNLHHKPILIPKNGIVEGEEIRIIAYVTGSYNLFGKAIFDLDEGQKIHL
ncbi:SOS-response transcriptional repressor LexA [Aminobacter niigataensis]|uniref:SOS-response transcriptional repressor LexA n=1 Tax=Aminobacter niigataensis TaxID=83265 RepID=A0ABR6L846_9HYPH|nr:XRE family transcriptional regulator [Aminobacter niigataensis]MBB4652970.1 SOS-response transcriptional repressor LexA [Aminobacter niigataensis]